MSQTPSHLQKILSDLSSNRTQLKQAMDQHELQHGINTEQLARFDTLIATVQCVLGNEDAIASTDAIKYANALPQQETDASSLGDAGAGNTAVSAPAG